MVVSRLVAFEVVALLLQEVLVVELVRTGGVASGRVVGGAVDLTGPATFLLQDEVLLSVKWELMDLVHEEVICFELIVPAVSGLVVALEVLVFLQY